MSELNFIKYDKIINAKKQDIHCDILGFNNEIIEPEENIIGFNDMVLQHISENVADFNSFIENFIENNPDYKDYHLETHYDKVKPFDNEYIPDVITSKIVTEFVRNDENDN